MKFIQDKYTYYQYIYHHAGCVNAGQTKEERRLKYAIARFMGKSRNQSYALRDFRKNNFAKKFGYKNWNELIKNIKKEKNE